MNKSEEHWQRIDRLFQSVLDLPPEARTAFIADVCGDDDALRDELLELLISGCEAETFFDGLAKRLRADLLEATIESDIGKPMTGRSLGPYRILNRIADGGMGTVYLGERADGQFEKKVAVKFLRRGLRRAALTHFLYERQILASLDHHSIAHLYDAGVTPDDRPYLIMEYVDGQRIDRYCDQQRLTLGQRITLFRTVCRAVLHAHQNLIIHRDIKPANILVTPSGTVKLLDFGIASLITEDVPQGDVQTLDGLRMLTPGYASPEQIRGEVMTTASDVYSLGVLLYELLTGHPPLPVRGRSLSEAVRITLEQEPIPPSEAVLQQSSSDSAGTDGPDTIARNRSSEPAVLHRRLQGDLDSIICKTLRKDPVDRYGGVEALLDDLDRASKGLPVAAHAAGLGYRTRKFVRRHRVGVVAASVALFALLAGLAGTLWQAAVAAGERDRAERSLAKERAVREFAVSLFDISNPNAVGFENISVSTLLEEGEKRIKETLGDQHELRAEMMVVLGNAYSSLGQVQKALPLLEGSLDIRRRAFGEESLEVAESLTAMGQLRQNEGAYDAAIPFVVRSLEIRRRELGEEHVLVAECLNLLGLLYWNKSKYDEAEPLLQESLGMRRRLLGDIHVEVAESLNNLGLVLHYKGREDEAEPLLREAVWLRKELLGPEHPLVANAMSNLALTLWTRQEYDQAETMLRDTLALRRKQLSADDPRIAFTLTNLGALLRYRGDTSGAEEALREALDIRRRVLGQDHRLTLVSLEYLALVLQDQGNDSEAESSLRELVEKRRRLLGPEHQEVATGVEKLGNLLHSRGDYAAAEPLLREALEIKRKTLGNEHQSVAYTLISLARLLCDRGECPQAEPLARESAGISRRRGFQGDMLRSYVELGYALVGSGRYAEGETLLREALELDDLGESMDRLTAEAQCLLGAGLSAQGRRQEAVRLFERCYPVLTQGKHAAFERPLLRLVPPFLGSF